MWWRRRSGTAPSASQTVLFAWELGGGLGHVRRLLPIASELASRGHKIVFALRRKVEEGLIRQRIPEARILKAPHWVREEGQEAIQARDYGDMLFQVGYATGDTLQALVQGWRCLFEEIGPALVVADHSPTAVLSAASRIPVVHVGSGFAIPPVGKPFLALGPDPTPGWQKRHERILLAIRDTQSLFESPALSGISELLSSAENFPCCLPELDPYQSVRKPPALGPMSELPPPGGDAQGRLFAYLDGSWAPAAALLESLARSGVSCHAYVRDLSADLTEKLKGSPVELYAEAPNLPEVLSKSSAVLHHGGLSTSETALAMGLSQFLVPMNVEQMLTADSLQRLGCGANLGRHKGVRLEVIRHGLKSRRFDREARRVAEGLARRSKVRALESVLSTCLNLLDGNHEQLGGRKG